MTASPSCTSAQKFAPEIGRTLLASTIAGSQGVDALAPEALKVEVSVSDASISVETSVGPCLSDVVELKEEPAADVAPVDPPLPSFFLNMGFDQEFQDELDEAELAEAAELHSRHFHEIKKWHRGQNGAFRHNYDFTDPPSKEGAKPEVVSLFKGFGLSTHAPPLDLAKWEETDLSVRHWNRVHKGFPYWMYPPRLHGFVMSGEWDGGFREKLRWIDYRNPSVAELREFMTSDLVKYLRRE